MTAYRFFSI